LSMFIKNAKIIEHEKWIQISHNKAKTTWGVIKNLEEIKKEVKYKL
jgi:hypothetical protein